MGLSKAGQSDDSSYVNLQYEGKDGKTYWIQYSHVNYEFSGTDIWTGKIVEPGDQLGAYGSYGGYGSVAHLHLSLKIDGVLSDPEPFLP